MTAFAPTVVYLLCLASSLLCAALLARSYLRARSRLLLWVALGFGALALNNLFLVVDVLVLPGVNFWIARQLAAAASILILLYGFIWEARDGR